MRIVRREEWLTQRRKAQEGHKKSRRLDRSSLFLILSHFALFA